MSRAEKEHHRDQKALKISKALVDELDTAIVYQLSVALTLFPHDRNATIRRFAQALKHALVTAAIATAMKEQLQPEGHRHG